MRVFYMGGAGNDFMVIDSRGQKQDHEALAKKLCKLTNADGFMALDESETADFRLHFYNSDGTRGEMCGNGSRCICKFAYDLGIAGTKMTVQTDAGIVCGERLGENQYRVKLNNPGVFDLHRREDCAYIELGSPGVPHGVTQIQGLCFGDAQRLHDYAVQLRHAHEFPKGANINFYTWLDESSVRVLTFERGVEDYTLACGTGSASVAAVLWAQGLLKGNALTVHVPGGTLKVTLEAQEQAITALYLEGPAQTLKIYDV